MNGPTILARLARSGNLPHALLFTGYDFTSKQEIALKLARQLFHENTQDFDEMPNVCSCNSCNLISQGMHPDFSLLDASPISIEQIRKLKTKFAATPLISRRKIALLQNCESMHAEAANAFLKLLEEPSGNSLFILLAKSRASVLTTIASRSFEVRFQAPQVALNPAAHPSLRIFNNGSLREKFWEAKKYNLENRSELLHLIDSWLIGLRPQMLKRSERAQTIKKILRLKHVIATTNANPRLLLEEFFVAKQYA